MSEPTIDRRALLLAATVALVTLAGCSALPFVGDDAEADPYTDSDEELDGVELQGDHLDRIGEAGSVTVNETTVLEIDGDPVEEYRAVTALDLDSGDAFRDRSEPVLGPDDLSERQVYHEDGVTYVNETRAAGPDQYTHYFTVDAPENDTEIQPLDLSVYDDLPARVDTLEWNHDGVVSHDPSGAGVTRYTATADDARIDAEFAAAYGIESIAELDEFQATLLVEEDGLVRKLRYETVETVETLDGEELEYRERTVLRLEDVGDTEVEEPEWTVRT